MAQLGSLLEMRQANERAQAVHSFGGNAAAFGAVQVQRASVQVENAARANDWPDIEFRVTKLWLTCSRLIAVIAHLKLTCP